MIRALFLDFYIQENIIQSTKIPSLKLGVVKRQSQLSALSLLLVTENRETFQNRSAYTQIHLAFLKLSNIL